MEGSDRRRNQGAPPSGEAPSEPGGRRRSALLVGASVVAVAGVLALLTIGLLAGRTDTSIADALATGEPYPAPEVTLPILANGPAVGRRDGATLSLAELRGRPVVLNFWASWCVPCEAEAPRLEAAWRRHRDRGLVMLGLNIQDLSRDALAFIARHRQTYPSLRDKGEGSFRAYQLTGVPETFFIDDEGMVRAKAIGEISDRQLEAGIATITTTEER